MTGVCYAHLQPVDRTPTTERGGDWVRLACPKSQRPSSEGRLCDCRLPKSPQPEGPDMKPALAGLLFLLLAACHSTGDRFPPGHAADETTYSVTGASDILVVYVGARNCPPCWRYKARDHPAWVASEEFQHVHYREIDFPRFQRTDEDRYWPEDLRWVREQAYARRGAPRWIVCVDGRVVANERSWNAKTLPLIRRLVARKVDG